MPRQARIVLVDYPHHIVQRGNNRMSNHVHILVTPKQPFSLAKLIQKLNLRYTQVFNQKYNRTGSLWEGRYFSSLVDKEKYFRYLNWGQVPWDLSPYPGE